MTTLREKIVNETEKKVNELNRPLPRYKKTHEFGRTGRFRVKRNAQCVKDEFISFDKEKHLYEVDYLAIVPIYKIYLQIREQGLVLQVKRVIL